MSNADRPTSPDEQVYQSNKHAPEVTEVYSNEAETAGDDTPLNQADPSLPTRQDEASAESFPASDPPVAPAAVPASPRQSSGDHAEHT